MKIEYNQLINFLEKLSWVKSDSRKNLLEYELKDKSYGYQKIYIPDTSDYIDYEEFCENIVIRLSDIYRTNKYILLYNIMYPPPQGTKEDIIKKMDLPYLYLRKTTRRFGDIHVLIIDLGLHKDKKYKVEYFLFIHAEPYLDKYAYAEIVSIDQNVFDHFGYVKKTFAFDQAIEFSKSRISNIYHTRVFDKITEYYNFKDYEEYLNLKPENLVTFFILVSKNQEFLNFIITKSKSKKLIEDLKHIKISQE